MPPVIVRFVSSTLVPSTERTEILWSPSRVTSAVLPSGENATLDGPEVLLPKSTLPAAVTVFPEMVSTDTVPSPRFATRARLPAVYADAGGREAEFEGRDHGRRVRLQVDDREPVVGDELLRVGRIELLV